MGPLVLMGISALFWGLGPFKNRGHQRVLGRMRWNEMGWCYFLCVFVGFRKQEKRFFIC